MACARTFRAGKTKCMAASTALKKVVGCHAVRPAPPLPFQLTSATSAPVSSHSALMELMLLMRWASMALAVSLASSALHRLVVRMRSRGTQCAYTSDRILMARWPFSSSMPPINTCSQHGTTTVGGWSCQKEGQHRQTCTHMVLWDAINAAAPLQPGLLLPLMPQRVWDHRCRALTLSGLSRSSTAVPSAKNSGLLRISKCTCGSPLVRSTCTEQAASKVQCCQMQDDPHVQATIQAFTSTAS